MRIFSNLARGALAVAGATVLAALLAACSGGGGSSPATPNAPANSNPSTGGSSTGGGSTSSTPSTNAPETFQAFTVSSADQSAAQSASNLKHHAFPVMAAISKGSTQEHTASIQYLEDLGYAGGKLVHTAETHNIYVSTTSTPSQPSIWGDPHGFLGNLGASSFIHVTDQYTGTSGTYGPGESAQVTSTNLSFGPLYDNDLLAIVHAVASSMKPKGASGYNQIFNLFLPPGVDTCFSFTTECYSPDNLSTFAFCAYHTSVDFNDIGHVLYTVEPFQPVQVLIGGQPFSACSIFGPTTDPRFLFDATDSTLSHETFETITDPDPPTGWTVPFSNGGVAGGAEIGDLCAYAPEQNNVLNGVSYEIQPEYSNQVHGCVNSNPATTANAIRTSKR